MPQTARSRKIGSSRSLTRLLQESFQALVSFQQFYWQNIVGGETLGMSRYRQAKTTKSGDLS